MPIDILMPALSPTMEKGNLAKWLKAEGDPVKSGDAIAEIETDKATMEVEAVDEGRLGKILVPEGTADVPVNTPIAVLLTEGEDAGAIAKAPASQPSPAKEAGAAPPSGAIPSSSQLSASGGDGAPMVPSGIPAPSPQPSPARGEGALPAPSGPTKANGAGARIFASPLARRVAKERGLDLAAISGTGPHGRIVLRDIDAAATAGAAKPTRSEPAPAVRPAAAPVPAAQPAAESAPAPAPAAPAGMTSDQIKKFFEPGSYTEVPHDSMRRTIARRLTESKLTIPHFYLTIDVDLGALLRLREELNAAALQADGKPAYKLSVNDFVIKALALALQRVPEANVTWTDGAMLKHKHSDVGVAVAIPGGLITPVIRKAEIKTLSAISNEMKDLAARAKARKLKPEEYQGGTTAVSNLGMFGIKDFCAVINPPHATILAVGAGSERAVVRGGQIVAATQMSVTLSTDHRAVDGALGAELLAAFKSLVEAPMGMLV